MVWRLLLIEDCKSAKNPKAYRTKHQAEYQLHDSLKKELQDLGVTKIPSSNKVQKLIENLESEQATTVLEKANLYKDISKHAMSDELLEKFIREYIGSQTMPQVLFTWHGGETLMRPLSFYKRVMEPSFIWKAPSA